MATYKDTGKRIFDLTLSVPALVLLAPLMGLVALLVRFKMGSPVLFRQERPGRYGQPFTILKFRTMTDARASDGRLLPDAERLTTLGNFLRSTSLDELPELFNVLKGQMSLVGPRPLLTQYLERYTSEQARRHEIRPGVTGWAQICGRNDTTWEERFELDAWYVDHLSLWLDFRIVIATIRVPFQRNGGIRQAWQLGEYMGAGTEPNRSGQISTIGRPGLGKGE